jgi:uncharacterized protein YdiU (UPF0061 family)
MAGLEQLFTEGIPTIVMASAFIYYLIQKDKRNGAVFTDFDRALRDFNKTLRNHLASQIKQSIATAKAQEEMARAFQQLTDCIKDIKADKNKL